MITKELFVASIEALREQYLFDKKNAEVLGEMFGTEISGAYDTSVLSKSIIALLQQDFPADADGHCAIEHWCYCQEFGKHSELAGPEELYNFLKAVKVGGIWAVFNDQEPKANIKNIHIPQSSIDYGAIGLDKEIKWTNDNKNPTYGGIKLLSEKLHKSHQGRNFLEFNLSVGKPEPTCSDCINQIIVDSPEVLFLPDPEIPNNN